jgi:hypothetical protein
MTKNYPIRSALPPRRKARPGYKTLATKRNTISYFKEILSPILKDGLATKPPLPRRDNRAAGRN